MVAAFTEPSGTYVYLVTAPIQFFSNFPADIPSQLSRYRLDNWTLEASLSLKYFCLTSNGIIGTF